jgi:DNA modification methylase
MTLPAPYYEEPGIVIYHGDCREILPTLPKVDLVLTDPPYGIGEAAGKNKSRVQLAVPKDYGVASWDDKVCQEEIDEARKQSKWQCIFGGNFYVLPPSPSWLVWDKDNTGDFADCELAWTNWPTAVRRIIYRWNGFMQEPGCVKETRYHPTQKPLPVIKWCLSLAPQAHTILDPFMGSGTTLRAAKDLGRQAIGIEIEEKYCEIAVNRLRQEVLNFT